MIRSSARVRRRMLARAGAVVAGAAALGVALSGCTLQSVVEIISSSELTCESWTLTPNGVNGSGTGGTVGDGEYYFGQVIDGDGTVLYLGEDNDTYSFPDGPVVATFDSAPASNPVIAGIYIRRGGVASYSIDDRVEFLTGCPGLSFQADVAPARGTTSPATTLPVFDIRFGETVTGFDVSDLVFGGTAGAVSATVAPISPSEQFTAFPLPTESTAASLYLAASYYRVTVTGVERDGAVTVQVPAGAVDGQFDDVNAASPTASAVVDRTGPTVGAEDIDLVVAAGETSAIVEWDLDASDPSGVAASTCTPLSGSTFPLGDTEVTCIVGDELGNETTHVFEVGVRTTPTVELVAQSTAAVSQGDTAVFTVTGTDDMGESAPLPATDYAVTSSVATDVIEKADGEVSVTFPHASPHTLTLTQTSTGAAAELLIDVVPAEEPGEETPGEETPGEETPPLSGGNEQTPASDLADTGADSTPLIIAAGALIVLGAAVLVIRAVRRRGDR